MIKNYKVIALYSSDEGNQSERVFSEDVGIFPFFEMAKKAGLNFEDQQRAPNFLECIIQEM